MASRVPLPVRRVAKAGVVVIAPVARGAVRAAVRRRPELGPRVAAWGWLWLPGWSRSHHEEFYGAAEDPYGFERKDYEREKYAALLEACGDGPFDNALEVGAAEGAFTDQLAPRCRRLVAADISEVAVQRVRRRFADRPEVVPDRRTLPLDFPEGTFDLIVCSDVIYLWEAGTVEIGLRTMIDRLRPGGRLVLLHYLGRFNQPVHADQVHDLALRLGADAGLGHPVARVLEKLGPHEAGFRIDVLTRP